MTKDATQLQMTLLRFYNGRYSVLTRKVSLDYMDELWLQDFTLSKWEYAYIITTLSTPQDITEGAQ